MTDILFQSSEIQVRVPSHPCPKSIIISFDSLHDRPGFDHQGFAEGIFTRNGFSAVYVIASRPHWFHVPEINAALAAVREYCADAQRILICGSSMGGYAALRFADTLNATFCLSFCPQYSADPRWVPFEKRWNEYRRRIFFEQTKRPRLTINSRTVVCFDPADRSDSNHIALIEQDVQVEQLIASHAGHVVSNFLHEIGLLDQLFAECVSGRIDVKAFIREVRNRRKRSLAWLVNLSHSQPSHRDRTGLALARWAHSLNTEHPLARDQLARSLSAAGHFEEAKAHHDKVLQTDSSTHYLWSYSKTLENAGEYSEALAITRKMQSIVPGRADYARRASELQALRWEWRAAWVEAYQAIRHAPRNSAYYIYLGRLACRMIKALLRGRQNVPRK